MLIKLPDDILSCAPIYQLKASKDGLRDAPAPAGDSAEGMPAAQTLLALFEEFQEVLNSYCSLIDYDSERMKTIVKGFVRSDS